LIERFVANEEATSLSLVTRTSISLDIIQAVQLQASESLRLIFSYNVNMKNNKSSATFKPGVRTNMKTELLDEQKVNIRVKLAALWTSFMFLYIYVDYFHLYMPGSIEDILAGRVFTFNISYIFLMVAMIFVVIPVLMIFLSVVLPAKVNRKTNIIIATVFIPYMLFNLVGEAWVHMYFAAAVEVALLLLIIHYARKWPILQK
jgi:hypothetical protein